jgi:hypothetical protein
MNIILTAVSARRAHRKAALAREGAAMAIGALSGITVAASEPGVPLVILAKY